MHLYLATKILRIIKIFRIKIFGTYFYEIVLDFFK